MMVYLHITAVIVMIFMLKFEPDIMRVEWTAVTKFLALMSLIVCMRISVASFKLEFFDRQVSELMANKMNNWSLGLVFLEEAFFVIPIYLFRKYISGLKKWWVPLVLLLSISFGFGHVYQGYAIAGMIALYPFFISYRYGMKFGFGTVMVCHVIYDHITVYLQKLMPYLLH